MDSSASDSRKEIACISYISKLSKKKTKKKQQQQKKKQENDNHFCEHFVTYLLVGTGAFVCCLVHRGSTDYLLLLQIFSGVV